MKMAAPWRGNTIKNDHCQNQLQLYRSNTSTKQVIDLVDIDIILNVIHR